MTRSASTEALIESLVRDARPVARLRPPMWRAGLWLGAVLSIAGVSILFFGDKAAAKEHATHAAWLVELAGTLATGCLAIIAAFHLSLPDRSPRWALLPLPTLLVWLAASGAGCWREWLARGEAGSLELGESGHCLAFIVGVGFPLVLALLWSLRRARPLAPLPVASTGALGGAALAAFVLQFFHPFEVTVMDLAIHAVGVVVVVAASVMGGRRMLS